MKLFKKILSAAVSASMIFSTALLSPVVSFAAGTDTVLYTLFTESNDPVEPNECYCDGIGDYKGNQWRYYTVDTGTKYGFPASAGKVYRANINVSTSELDEQYASQTTLPGKELLGFGMQFLIHSNGRWQANTFPVGGYVDTAAVTAKLNVSKESYVDDLYMYLKSRKNGEMSYTAVKLGDKYYTKDDVGKPKTISIPLKEFVHTDDTAYTINGGFDPAYFSAAGFVFVNASSDERGYVAYDDLRMCNVERPANLRTTELTDAHVSFSWEPSASDIENYVVLRDGEEIAETTDTSFTDDTIVTGQQYTYEVQAVDKYGAHSSSSNSVDVYASSIGTPQNFEAVSSYPDALKAVLTWEAPAFGTPVGYEVYRDGEQIAETDADTLEYTDESEELSVDNYYTYYVKAKSDTDISMPSDERKVFVTYIGYPENVTAEGDLTIHWGEIASAVKYNIYRNGELLAVADAGTLEYTDGTREFSKAYTYHVCAVNSAGRESRHSEKVTTIKYESNKSFDGIFDDSAKDNYYVSGVGTSTAASTSEQKALGGKAVKVTLTPVSYVAEGASFTAVSPINLTDARANGDRLEFFIYAENEDMLANVKVGFACPTDKLENVEYIARTGLALSDYVTQYGYWNYISIPVSSFPQTGYYSAGISNNRTQKFKFDNVTEICFYSNDVHYLADKSFYVDEVAFAKFGQPTVAKVTLPDGTEITSGAEISAETKSLKVKFDVPMDASSLDGNVYLTSDSGNIPAETNYDSANDELTVNFAAGLSKSTVYALKFDGVKSANGTESTGLSFDFTTNADGSAETVSMADAEAVTIDSQTVKKGSTANVKLSLVSDAAKKTPVSALDVTVTFDANVLSATKDSILLASSLKDAVVSVADGKITIKLDKTAKTYVIGSYIANIAFDALRAGSSDITVSGTLSQAQPEKSVNLSQSGTAQIVVSNITDGGGSGSGGGGKRSEGSSTGRYIPVTDASQTQTPQSNTAFSDLPASHWSAKAVEYLNKADIIKGYDDGTFIPDAEVTREEFTAMLVRAFLGVTENTKTDFADVSESDWFASSVASAAEAGIVNGTGNAFGTGETISRQDMCAMLERTAKACGISLSGKYGTILFADEAEIADYAKESVRLMQTAGVVNGVGNEMFNPTGKVTRAMAAKVIYELLMLK